MPNKRWLRRVLLVVGSVMILIGAALLVYVANSDEDRDVIQVDLSEEGAQVLEFESLGLVPGAQCEYVIQFQNYPLETFDMTLSFVDMDAEKNLKNFARVKIVSNGEILCDELLATVLDGDAVELTLDLKKRNEELLIVYYLPIEVGNEAKNAEADFEIHLTATNE